MKYEYPDPEGPALGYPWKGIILSIDQAPNPPQSIGG